MELEKWLNEIGRDPVVALAEGMPGGTHGKTKPTMIKWILSDKAATRFAMETMDYNEKLDRDTAEVEVGFVNYQGDAL